MMVTCRVVKARGRLLHGGEQPGAMPLHWRALLLLAFLPCLCLGKLCTNTGVSHTLQSQVFSALQSDVERSFTSPGFRNLSTLSSTGGSPRRVIIQAEKKSNSSFLESISLHSVRLSPDSPYGTSQQTNVEYLLMLDMDSLVYSFRTTAGLDAPGSAYGGWEDPSSELRGHFVGHYLSATAMTWASTHNFTVYQRMNEVIGALAECQSKIGTGYLSAFPESLFDRFEALEPVWAPYYTIHKIMAGLLDQYTYAENEVAFEMLIGMAQYFSNRVEAVIRTYTIERHWQSLNEETGGMNDVMYRLYQITGDEKYLTMAHLFDKPCFLGMLAVQADSVSGFHANTHIPIVVGAQMRYEVVGDSLFKELSEYFMDIIATSHTYATGGTSAGEFWSDPNRLGTTLGTENQESCTTYNMLKVARNLFRWTKEIKYADYYERALLNGVLTIQRGQQPGVMIYMLPLAPGSSKAKSYHGWGTPYSSFWCCYGTAIESFSKLGDSIFFEDKQQEYPHLFVTRFVSSTVSWDAAGLSIKQSFHEMSSVNPVLNVTFMFTQSKASGNPSTISVRIPYWAEVSKYSLNGVSMDCADSVTPGKFISTTREWQTGDTLSFTLSALLWIERIQDERPEYSTLYAVYYGPYLLAGMSDGKYDLGSVNISAPSNWISPVVGGLLSFSQQEGKFLAANKHGILSMIDMPSEGSPKAAHATFKVKTRSGQVTFKDFSSLVDNQISLELVHQPGKYVAHSGVAGGRVTVSDRAFLGSSSSRTMFKVVLDQQKTVSLEACDMPGCFLSTAGSRVVLSCDDKFNPHFTAQTGLFSYHPMSFEAYGSNSSFLLFPLSAYRDEHYAVYFSIQT